MFRRWHREREIIAYMPQVNKLARQLRAQMFPFASVEDLVSAGTVGLLEAAQRYEPDQGSFAPFAYWRTRGAMIDAHKRQAYREEQHDSIEDIHDRLGYLPAEIAQDNRPLPDAQAERSEMERAVQVLISELPELEASLMRLVMEGSSVPEAARKLGRSPAWGRARLAAARDRVGAGMVLR